MSRTRLLAPAVALLILCAACSTAPSARRVDDDRGRSTSGTRAPAGRLSSFSSCSELQEWVAVEGAPRVSLLGWQGDPSMLWAPDGGAVDLEAAELSAAATADGGDGDGASRVPAGEEAPAFSGTNVQEDGVDEPDVVKTDGSRLVAAVGGRLYVLDVMGASPRITGSVSLDGGADHELLMEGNRVFVLSSAYPGDGPLPVDTTADRSVLPAGGETTTLQEVDISDPSDPVVVATQSIEGRYLTARVVDGVARVVVSTAAVPVAHVEPTAPGAAAAAAAAVDADLIAGTEADHWLPHVTTLEGDDTTTREPLVGCQDVSRPDEFAGFGTITVISVDLDEPLDTSDAVSVMADGDTVYASTDTLYVATSAWADPSIVEPLVEAHEDGDGHRIEELQRELAESYGTTIHRFAIGDPGSARYEGSGTVPGHLLNQFSMSEHEGVLRVASTAGQPWTGSESMVTTLRFEGQQLVQIGQVSGLGRGEEIHAVRFLGDAGYVVTFQQTDPLFVLDLSDPENPALSGELEIPGYSAYLHPIGDGRLLGIGQDATAEGMLTGSQISLFDVSDPADPTRIDQLRLGAGSSEVEWNHRAFLWWAPDDLAFVPLQSWDEGHPVSGGVGVEVDGDELIERGRVAPPAREGCPDLVDVPIEDDITAALIAEITGSDEPLPEVCQTAPSSYLRAIVIGDRVVTVSPDGVGAHALDTLARTAWLDWTA